MGIAPQIEQAKLEYLANLRLISLAICSLDLRKHIDDFKIHPMSYYAYPLLSSLFVGKNPILLLKTILYYLCSTAMSISVLTILLSAEQIFIFDMP